MGLDQNSARLLMHSRNRGVDFTETLMIGRQSLLLRPGDFHKALNEFGIPASRDLVDSWFAKPGAYAEGFLESLGAQAVASLDHSDYEGATLIHDLNEPIGPEHAGRFSLVLDSGTLEHIFNFPTALRSCMEMVRPGGHLMLISPANNVCGHGFYQFSPELFFSALAEENGYQIEELAVFEASIGSPWYRVADPSEVRSRVTLLGSVPVYLFALAKRVSDVRPFASAPQQSDYVAAWQSNEWGSKAKHTKRFMDSSVAKLPVSVRRAIFRCMRLLSRQRGFRPDFYQRVTPQKSGKQA